MDDFVITGREFCRIDWHWLYCMAGHKWIFKVI